MRTLLVRTASGIVFVALMIGCILWNQYSYLAIMSLVLLGSILEYYRIIGPKKEAAGSRTGDKWLVLIFGLLAYWQSFFFLSPPATITPDTGHAFAALLQALMNIRDAHFTMNGIIPMLVFVIFIYELFTGSENPFGNIGWNIIPVFWILVPIALTNQLYFQHGGAFVVAIFFSYLDLRFGKLCSGLAVRQASPVSTHFA